MSVTLHPGIGGLDTQGLCYSLYRQLYQTFFNAQERKSEDNPYGVEEGDDTSIRLHKHGLWICRGDFVRRFR